MFVLRAAAVGLLVTFAALPACRRGGDEPRPRSEDGPSVTPKLSVTPPPGDYDTYELDVRVAAEDPAVELIVSRNAPPVAADDAWGAGPIVTKLQKSGTVRVVTRDREGRVFGPVAFVYGLAERYNAAACRIDGLADAYFGPAEPITVDVTYALASSLSKVELLVNGEVADSVADTPNPFGMATMTAAPLGLEGAYEVSCRVTSPLLRDVVGAGFMVYVDATAPGAAWLTGAGWNRPTHFLLEADDYGGAGVARAEVCNATFSSCLPMRQVAGAQFGFATAFVPDAGAAFALTARVYDAVGNRTDLPAAAVAASEIPTGAAPYLNAITLVTEASYDLNARLGADGLPAAAEARDLDFAPVPVNALPLRQGWNEFLFRAAGAPSWETFGIYRAGVSVTLPTLSGGAWLVYASTSTIPAMQGERIDLVAGTSAEWSRAWFQVPRLFFVADAGNDGAWDDGDLLYQLDATDPGGRWLRDGEPLRAGITAVTPVTASARTADVDCAGCSPGGMLVLQRRARAHAAPVGRQSWPAADLSAGPLAAHGYGAQAGERCLFFWDESGDGAPGRDEPRAEAACDAASFSLRRAGTLAVTSNADALVLTGLRYGGVATGALEVTVNATRVLRSALLWFDERDGTGERSAPLPFYATWPAELSLWSGGSTASTALQGIASAVTTTGEVEVRDEDSVLLAAAVEAHSPGVSDYALFDGLSPSVPLAYAEGTVPRVRALRDGYLSEWLYPSASFVTLRLLSPAATGLVQGVVRDAAGLPVAGASITWEADPYAAQTASLADGTYELPALGAGHLVLRHGAEAAGQTVALTLNAGDAVALDLHLPAANARWPAGLLAGARTARVTGPAPVTVFTDGRYAWARVSDGIWALESPPNFVRAFTAPGALPAFSLENPALHALGWTAVLLESTLTLRCGARTQRLAFGAWLLLDSPCWELYAENAGVTYFLGRPDPVSGVPDTGLTRWYGQVEINGVPAANYPVRLRDVLFNRTLDRVTDGSGFLHIVLPHGDYRVETLGGTPLLDAAGNPARIEASHLGAPDAVVHLP